MGKQRRIIYNDDGAAEKPSYNPEATAEGFLDAYFNSAVDTQVDTWVYNWGNVRWTPLSRQAKGCC